MNFKKCLLVLILFTLTLISIKAGYAHIDSITMLSPAEGYTSLTSNPDFNFSVAGNESTYNCSLFVDDTLKANNGSTVNKTATRLNPSLSDAVHQWYVNCTDIEGTIIQTPTSILTATDSYMFSQKKKLVLGDNLNAANPRVNSTDLPNMLASGTIEADDSSLYDYDLYIGLPISDTGVSADINNNNLEGFVSPKVYYNLGTGSNLAFYNATIDFKDPWNATSFTHGETMALFGGSLFTFDQNNTDNGSILTLYRTDSDALVENGSEVIIVNNGTNYTVDVLGGNNVTNEGTLQIDGIPTVVKKGDFKTIDGLPVFIKEIFISNSPPFVSINFSYGVQKLELQYAVSGGQVKLDNNVLDEVTLSVNQSGVQKWVGVNRLTFTVTPKDAQDQVNYLLNGSEYTDPLFGKFKFHFVGATDLSLGKEPFSLQQFGSILELTFMPKGATSPTTLFLLDNNSYYSDFVNASTLANLKVSDEFIYNEYPGYADKAVTHLLQITLIQNANNISNANFSALVYDVSFDKFYNVTHCAAVDSRIALYPAPGSDANHLTLTNDSDCDVITNGSAFKNLPQIYANAGARIEFLNSTNGTIANASQIPTGIGYINVTEDAQHDAQASTATSFVLKYSWNATAGAYSVTLANPGTATGNIGNDDLRNFWLSKFGTYVVADKNATPFKFVNMYIPARESTYDMFLMPPDGTLRTVIPSVTVDGAAPTINITSPVNNTVQPDSNVTLTFSASDGNGLDKCWYELSGANTTISCSSLSKTVMLANGAYNITFYANDTFGKSSSKKYNFTVTDTTAPSITGGTVTKTTTTADIPWTSNELLYKVRVYYGLDSSLDETPISVTNPSGTSGTVSLDSLSNGRTYYYIIEACDADTHTLCANTSQASFTTNHASSSGGGGGGGGSSSSTPASSNAFYATTFDQVLSGSTNLTLTSIVIAFNQLTITTNVNTANVKFTVQALADSPHAYTMPVFQYLEVNHTNLDDSSINGVKIKFTVPKSWLTSNNIASSDVRLVRYYNGIWTPLSTTKQSEDTTNVYYQADSPGLSLYAISTQSAQQSAPVVNTTNTTNTTAVVTPTTPTPTTPTTPEATPTTPTSASGSNAWIIIVIIVVVAIAAIVIFIVYKKKKV